MVISPKKSSDDSESKKAIILSDEEIKRMEEVEEKKKVDGITPFPDKNHDLKQKKAAFWTFSSSNKPMYETPEEMQEKILEYFTSGRRTRQVYDSRIQMYREVPIVTITGLALYLGFADRRSLYEYEEKEAFTHTIKRARGFMEMEYEEMLSTGNHTAAIFALKNFGWKDTQHIEGEMNNNNKNQSVVVEYKQGKYEDLDENGEVKSKEKK